MSLKVEVRDNVHRPIEDVWDAIVNKDKMTQFFTSRASSSLSVGKVIEWEFADYNVTISIYVLEIVKFKYISFRWAASGNDAIVKMYFNNCENGITKIEITEESFAFSKNGISKVMQQTQGWTNFICSMKTWLYTGVNLRTGI